MRYPAARSSSPRDGPDSGTTTAGFGRDHTAVGYIPASAWTDVRGLPAAVKPSAAWVEFSPMTSLQLSPDAVTVLGLAGTALPFAQSVDDEVERWLRPLRLYGQAGSALQSLGVSEGRLGESQQNYPERSEDSPSETLHLIATAASQIAAERGGTTVGTSDILLAVMAHYGDAFDRALRCRSSDSAELMIVLGERAAA